MQWLNPRVSWCYANEDWVGRMAQVGSSTKMVCCQQRGQRRWCQHILWAWRPRSLGACRDRWVGDAGTQPTFF
eukprot:2015213-Alexandrium_andersonii.AAC.1